MHINQPNLPCHALFPRSIYRIAFQKMYQFCIEVQGGFVMADDLHIAEGGGYLDEWEKES
jgi:hypothetical protein